MCDNPPYNYLQVVHNAILYEDKKSLEANISPSLKGSHHITRESHCDYVDMQPFLEAPAWIPDERASASDPIYSFFLLVWL